MNLHPEDGGPILAGQPQIPSGGAVTDHAPAPSGVAPLRVAVVAAAALVVGVASGATLAGTPDVKAPHQCTVMATVAEKRAIVQDNLVHVVNARGDALDKDEYRVLNDDVVALESELDPLDADYREAKAACLGGAK
jgi:hypothetical protein